MPERIRYEKMVPPESFLGRYLADMQNQETAEDFDFWGGMWLLSVACGRRLIIDRPRAPVYMNLYLTLVAESGISRKSTAIYTATQFAKMLIDSDPSMRLLEGKTTPEQLLTIMGDLTDECDMCQIVLSISELAAFLGTETYMNNMPVTLTDLYDCPQSRSLGGTQLRGAHYLKNVYVTFIAASTPIWLLRSVNPAVVEGGYTSRSLFVVCSEPKRRIAWPTAASLEDSKADRDYMLAELKRIRGKAIKYGSIPLSDGALATFKGWYNRRHRSYDPYSASFEAREDAHLLRVAGFLAMNDDTWLIQGPHIQKALRIIDRVKSQAAKLFAGAGSAGKFAMGIDRIRSYLIGAGMDPVMQSRLYMTARKHIDHAEFMALIEVMHELGAIQRFEMRANERGRAIEYVRGTKLLVSRGLSDALLQRFS